MRFWCSVLLRAGSYRGNPMAAHRPLDLDDQHFDRWLALWDTVTLEIMAPEHAAALQEKAQRIGESLKLALYYRPDNAARGAA